MMKRLLAFALMASAFTACDDPDYRPTEISSAVVNYKDLSNEVSESSAGYEVVVLLANAAETSSSISIEISADDAYGTYFTTSPAPIDGKILLDVTQDDTEVSFIILPINNTKLNGNKSADFTIVNASGSVSLGESLQFTILIEDDELSNKLQVHEKNGLALTYSKSNYEYNEAGLVSKIFWEARTGFGGGSGVDEYFYNEDGGISHVSRYDGAHLTQYTWNEGVIVKVERIQNGEIMAYNAYEYDEAGRVKNVDMFTKGPSGNFTSSTYDTYTYHEDGNVHQIVTYSFNATEGEFVVSITSTYEGYVEGHNPTPMEILPNHKIQTKLPTSYSRAVAGDKQEYEVAYEFSENGNLTKKTVTGAIADSGVTTYAYY